MKQMNKKQMEEEIIKTIKGVEGTLQDYVEGLDRLKCNPNILKSKQSLQEADLCIEYLRYLNRKVNSYIDICELTEYIKI